MSLPVGHTARPMRLDDAALIAEQSAAYTSALLGFPKHSPEDVANYLRDPGVDLATDGWVVNGPDGFAGSATAVRITGGSHVNVDILGEDPAVLGWLLDQAERRAREAGRAEVILRVGVIHSDERLAAILAARGFAIGTSAHRMRITFDGPVAPPVVPEGVVVRRGAPDEASRRAAHAVLMEAFEEQPGTLPRPFEEWAASRESRSTFDWSQVTIAELDGQPVGMTECNDNFVSTDNCGYVGRLAVVPSARGRGLAKFLLRNAFAVDAAAGRAGTILHVDTSNPTPAVALYTGVGMRPDLISDVWMRTIAI
ncbi:GNAT family N-acetyltransferase [Kribbella shirazensis]|uniref:Ribosomal protein S18 acetylase RimI-like enzyme n=1 Tax=Kribbella shirazensis TaxID=1105143 RepID=A0A7X5VFJ5_9ACTN|nr:GNAT family N-acetyltransferase [Kribbella shirazensis]NIK60296.1 ribosomal protein S18 acetylase RimI-like enzyme [Kribbella shirazensis]